MCASYLYGRLYRASLVRVMNKYAQEPSTNFTPKRKFLTANQGIEKTVAFVVNKKTSGALSVEKVSTNGFVLANGSEFVGPTILFPHSIFSWNIKTVEDVDEDSLIMFKILEPKLDLLVFGYGEKEAYTMEVRKRFTDGCKNIGIRFEALPTTQACGIFNFLALEQRIIAGAFIPPRKMDTTGFLTTNLLTYDDEYEDDDDMELSEDEIEAEQRKYLK